MHVSVCVSVSKMPAEEEDRDEEADEEAAMPCVSLSPACSSPSVSAPRDLTNDLSVTCPSPSVSFPRDPRHQPQPHVLLDISLSPACSSPSASYDAIINSGKV